MFPSLKQRPTLAREQDTLPSLSVSLFPQFLIPHSPSLCPLVSLLVSLNKLQRFLGNMVFRKKVTMAFFWHTTSSLLLRIWGCHDISGHLIKNTIVYVCMCVCEHACVCACSMDIVCQPQLNA